MTNTMTDMSNRFIDQAAHSADEAIHNTQRLASQAVNGVSHSLQTARKQIVAGANQASDKTIAYVRDEPVKSMLIAAATVAALVAITHLISSTRKSR